MTAIDAICISMGEGIWPVRINLATSAVMGITTIAIGIFCGYFFGLAESAANSLINPAAYIEAVLGTPVNP